MKRKCILGQMQSEKKKDRYMPPRNMMEKEIVKPWWEPGWWCGMCVVWSICLV